MLSKDNEEDWSIPGTVHMFKSSYGDEQPDLIMKGDVVLMPQPSNSPNDPLTWSLPRKYWHTFILMFTVGLTAATSNAASAAQDGLQDAYGLSDGVFNTGAGVLFAGIGYWTVISGATAHLWGNRINYIFGTIFGIAGNVWYAKTSNNADAIVSQLFVGASESVAEAIVQHSLSQIFYLHEMSPAIGMYVLATSVGTFLGPLIGGYLADNIDWPWVGWTGAIFSGFALLLTFFGLEETSFDRNRYITRSVVELSGKPLSPAEKAAKEKQAIAERTFNSEITPNSSPSSHLEKKVPVTHREIETSSEEFHQDSTVQAKDLEASANVENTKTYWQRIALITPAANIRGWGFKQLWQRFLLNFRVYLFPAVIWSGLQWGAQSAWLTFYLTLEDDWWSEPPYNYGDAGVALMNIPTLIGAIIGCVYASFGSDLLVHYMTKRNNGVCEAEFRLYALLPAMLISPAGMFLLGCGTEQQWAWPVPYVGLGFIGFGYGSVGDLSMSYVMDCYPEMVLESFIGVSAVNNSLGMIMSFVCNSWMNIGPQNTFISVGVLDFFFIFLTVPFIIWGKACRKWTRGMYNRFIEIRDALD